MRIYKVDGSFTENQLDTEFGWSVDNEETEDCYSDCKEMQNKSSYPPDLGKLLNKDSFLESVDITEPVKPTTVQHIEVDVRTEPIVNVINCKMETEGPAICKNKSKLRRLTSVNIKPPSNEDLANLINPCNLETKSLMSVIYFAKYKSLIKEEISTELFKTVNLKTTNFKCLIKDKQENVQQQIIKDMQHYNANKEENMLSLMMELILADLGCNVEDVVDTDMHNLGEINPEITSDLGNSIQSRDLSSLRSNYSDVPNRCSILSSIGLSDEEKSIQSIGEETLEMRLQTSAIRKSFQDDEDRVNKLIKMATALKEEMKETLYLDDILYLLKGDIDKVKLIKLPFKDFHSETNSDTELNLII